MADKQTTEDKPKPNKRYCEDDCEGDCECECENESDCDCECDCEGDCPEWISSTLADEKSTPMPAFIPEGTITIRTPNRYCRADELFVYLPKCLSYGDFTIRAPSSNN